MHSLPKTKDLLLLYSCLKAPICIYFLSIIQQLKVHSQSSILCAEGMIDSDTFQDCAKNRLHVLQYDIFGHHFGMILRHFGMKIK